MPSARCMTLSHGEQWPVPAKKDIVEKEMKDVKE
jgi:hypothetical protein